MVPPPKTKRDIQHIQAFARMRPFNRQEIDSFARECVTLTSKDVIVNLPHGTKKYTFDKVFSAHSKQRDVYKSVCEPIVQEVLLGYNCTILAYGQTGTGKTYTMVGEETGPDAIYLEDTESGMIPRVLDQLFDNLRRSEDYDFTIRVSYLEIYNEVLTDLLATDDTKTLKIYEDSKCKGSVQIHGLEEVTVFNKKELHNILKRGSEKKNMAATALNPQSSRSHTVFTITVHGRETTPDGEELVRTGKLNLVDLAGSENISKSRATDKRAKEAGNINQSLLTLGRVIKALVDKSSHVPYRESKLTRILQDSLGGKTKTTIIATFTPSSNNLDETISTLEYAFRARNITIRPEVNQKFSKTVLVQNYLEQMEKLKKDLTAAQKREGIFLDPENYNMIINERDKLREELCQSIEECSGLGYRIQESERKREELQNVYGLKEIELTGVKENLQKFKKNYKSLKKQRRVQQELIDLYDDSQTEHINYAKALSDALDRYCTEHGMLRTKVDELYNNQDDIDKSVKSLVDMLNVQRYKMISTMGSWTTLIENCEETISKITGDGVDGENKINEKFRLDSNSNQTSVTSLVNEIVSNLKHEVKNFNVHKNANQQNIERAALELIDKVVNTKANEIFRSLKKVDEFKVVVVEKINDNAANLSHALREIEDKLKAAAIKIKTESKDLLIKMDTIIDQFSNCNDKMLDDINYLKSQNASYTEKIEKLISMQNEILAESTIAIPDPNDKKNLQESKDYCNLAVEDLKNLRKMTSYFKCVVNKHVDYSAKNLFLFSENLNVNTEGALGTIQRHSQDLESATQDIKETLENSILDITIGTNNMVSKNTENVNHYEEHLNQYNNQQEILVQGILNVNSLEQNSSNELIDSIKLGHSSLSQEVINEISQLKSKHFQYIDELFICMKKQQEDVETYSTNIKVVPKTGTTPGREENLPKAEMPSKILKKMAISLFKRLEEETSSSCDDSINLPDEEVIEGS